ncbi:uncharacterized protein MKK02DRAFT_40265 [Dioszegia hungarica]|uniref:Uncharacterized protein n=1 Tax=Dioszegia hungarica TaxID=4972 RepID=A0AA38LS49_9TREE|nr:uncharacterized protein MKK02DRAFT_40265 [Dioszegia hungarica]KAI9633103.1 hypothetical protein MKK02DRAFT_40265 [Dioszegia hungarica]
MATFAKCQLPDVSDDKTAAPILNTERPDILKDLFKKKERPSWITTVATRLAKEGYVPPPYDENHRPDLTKPTFAASAMYGPLAPPSITGVNVYTADGQVAQKYEMHEFKVEFLIPKNDDGGAFVPDEIPDDIALIIITMERMESAKGLPALSMACRWESYQELANRGKAHNRSTAVIKTIQLRAMLRQLEHGMDLVGSSYLECFNFAIDTYGELLGRWNLFAEWCDAVKQDVAIPAHRDAAVLSATTASAVALREHTLKFHPSGAASMADAETLRSTFRAAIMSTTSSP